LQAFASGGRRRTFAAGFGGFCCLFLEAFTPRDPLLCTRQEQLCIKPLFTHSSFPFRCFQDPVQALLMPKTVPHVPRNPSVAAFPAEFGPVQTCCPLLPVFLHHSLFAARFDYQACLSCGFKTFMMCTLNRLKLSTISNLQMTDLGHQKAKSLKH